MRAHRASVIVLVLAALVSATTSTVEGNSPKLAVHFPEDGGRAVLPLHVRYSASAPCRSALAVDGLIVGVFEHGNAAGFTADVHLPSVSLDPHVLSLDIVDEHGNLLDRGPRWTVEVERGEEQNPSFVASSHAEDAYGEDEPVAPYDPNMSAEDMEQAEFVDGWWLVKQDNFEFTRPEPYDTCEDVAGWHSRTRTQGPRRIWDTFQLFNELDMLEVRLHELNETVHRFVLVEATRTHSNQPKPLHFADNKARFSQFLHKIVHVVVDDLPNNTDAWVLENFQRNAVLRGLAEAHPNDLIVIADVDEIPVPYVLNLLRHCDGPSWPVWLYSRFFNFKFAWEFAGQWKHPQVIRAGQLALPHLDQWHKQQQPGRGGGGVWTGSFRPVLPQQVRMGSMRPHHTKIESGGWHCSFFTDADGVLQKVAAFTHQELNVPSWRKRDAIAEAIEEGTDYFNADMQGNRKTADRHGGLGPNPSCHGLPKYVLMNANRFQKWLPDCRAAHGEEVELADLAWPVSGSCPSP